MPLREALRGPLMADGAYGTALRSHVPSGGRVELLNLDAPDTVLTLARDYVAAGAQVLWTNTFGVILKDLNEDLRRDAVLRAGVEIARAAGGGSLPVLAALGPLRGEAVRGYARLGEVAMTAGADGVVLETMTHAEDARAAAALLTGLGVPLAVTFTIKIDAQGVPRTPCGGLLCDAARRAEDAGAMAVGVNCCDGPATVLAGLAALQGAVGVPIIARPNAGVGETMAAAEFAASGARLFAAGATVVGGCCGTTPAHLAAMAHLRP